MLKQWGQSYPALASTKLQPDAYRLQFSCSLCSENRFRNDGCIAETHLCMQGVDTQQVIRWLEATLA